VHVPSHLPAQATPPDAVQLPVQLPLQLPVQSNVGADAEAVHDPVHDASSVPPVHVGGFACTLQLALALQPPWQLACAEIETSHSGGTTVSEIEPDAATAVLMLLVASPHQ
jgi:hypothetical protein